MGSRRFPIRFDAWYRVPSSALFLPPARCHVEVGAEDVEVPLRPPQRARVVGFPVRLERLRVSVVEPALLVAALRAPR